MAIASWLPAIPCFSFFVLLRWLSGILSLRLLSFSFFVLLLDRLLYFLFEFGSFSFFVLLLADTTYLHDVLEVLVSLCCYNVSVTPSATSGTF